MIIAVAGGPPRGDAVDQFAPVGQHDAAAMGAGDRQRRPHGLHLRIGQPDVAPGPPAYQSARRGIGFMQSGVMALRFYLVNRAGALCPAIRSPHKDGARIRTSLHRNVAIQPDSRVGTPCVHSTNSRRQARRTRTPHLRRALVDTTRVRHLGRAQRPPAAVVLLQRLPQPDPSSGASRRPRSRRLRLYGVGAGASRLVTGNHPLYGELEARLARSRAPKPPACSARAISPIRHHPGAGRAATISS